MDALAQRAGLGKGTVFRRFGTRAGIFQALLDDDERAFQEQVLSGPPPLGPGAPPLDRLIAYGRARIGFLIEHREVARAALDGSQPIPAGAQTPLSQTHIRVLLGQIALGACRSRHPGHPAHRRPGWPAAALPVGVRPDRGGRADRGADRPGLAGPRATRLPAKFVTNMFVTNLFLTNMFVRVQSWPLKPVPPPAAASGPPSRP